MPKFTSKLPCPQVDLPSGASVQFVNHEADVDAKTAKELSEHLDELGYLGITKGKAKADEAEVPEVPDHDHAGAPPPPGDLPIPSEYDDKSVAELRKLAEQRNITVAARATKETLIDVLSRQDGEAAATAGGDSA